MIQKIGIFVFCLFFIQLQTAFAGNPLLLNSNGMPLVWDVRAPIRYKIDPGKLGRLSHEQMLLLVQKAMSVWEEVPGTGIRFEYVGTESADINSENYKQYSNTQILTDANADLPNKDWTPSQTEGYLLIVLDEDSQIIKKFSDPSVIGNSSITAYKGSLDNPQFIKAATVTLNGLYVDGDNSNLSDITINDLLATLIHELGHALGVGHSVFNHTLYNDMIYGTLDRSYVRYLPTMFPAIVRFSGEHYFNLHPDDIATLKWMYGDPLAQVSGNVTNASSLPLYSMIVTVRNEESPLCLAYSQATGVLCDYESRLYRIEGRDGVYWGTQCDETKLGYYSIPVLDSGNYTLDVGEINTLFGTSVISQFILGAYPQAIPGSAELYNENEGPNEDPYEFDVIPVSNSKNNLNFVLSSDDVLENRLRRIHHSFFEEADHIYCPEQNPTNVAGAIGIEEWVIPPTTITPVSVEEIIPMNSDHLNEVEMPAEQMPLIEEVPLETPATTDTSSTIEGTDTAKDNPSKAIPAAGCSLQGASSHPWRIYAY